MLIREDLLKGIDEKYHDMLKQVNIADFTKCIAYFSGIHISELKDDIIKQYLHAWAYNKYRFYKKLGNKLYIDRPIDFEDQERDLIAKNKELQKKYPGYALWLDVFRSRENKNKIDMSLLDWQTRDKIEAIFGWEEYHRINGTTLTHFFKNHLQAPDELVTDIGRLFENQRVIATHTISIDPVDMMLASENPYDWNSCYRLELGNCDSHADGCLAAVLDSSTLITYVWNNEGGLSLYKKYEFKKVRYKRMRQWISISPDEDAIHFNAIYPGKNNYTEDFKKMLRQICENFVDTDATWAKNDNWNTCCERQYYYGYDEYNYSNIYYKKQDDEENNEKPIKGWMVFDTGITCPCGCGDTLHGSSEEDGDDEYRYTGDGFCCYNFYTAHYCEYIDDYCDCDDCYGCENWNRNNPVCSLDESESCNERNVWEAEEEDDDFRPWRSNVMQCNPERCEGCPLYKYHHPEEPEIEE